jgi:hypothetical protein
MIATKVCPVVLRSMGSTIDILSNVVRSLGTWSSSFDGQVWAFFQCQPDQILPEAWLHHASDDGGHTFRFFWHPLSSPADPSHWHLIFRNALSFIQRAII